MWLYLSYWTQIPLNVCVFFFCRRCLFSFLLRGPGHACFFFYDSQWCTSLATATDGNPVETKNENWNSLLEKAKKKANFVNLNGKHLFLWDSIVEWMCRIKDFMHLTKIIELCVELEEERRVTNVWMEVSCFFAPKNSTCHLSWLWNKNKWNIELSRLWLVKMGPSVRYKFVKD